MISQAPALFIILPIIFALILLVTDNLKISKVLLIIFHIIIGIIIYKSIGLKTEQKYVFGGWSMPFAIEFIMNKMSMLFLALLYLSSALTLLSCWHNFEKLIFSGNQNKFFSVYLICIAGFSGIILTNDLFNLYVFVEVSSLATYALASASNRRQAIKSSVDYLIIGTFAATLILFGIAFIYVGTGTLNLSHMSQILSEQKAKSDVNILSNFGFIFIVSGVIIKFALFPFHRWVINIYRDSSYFITIFFSAISTKIALFILYKMQISFYDGSLLSEIGALYPMLILSGIGIIFTGYVALFQVNIRSILGYSSAGQICYILICLIVVSKQNYLLFFLLIAAHSLAKMLLFIICSCLQSEQGELSIQYISKHKSNCMILLVSCVIASASVIGVPGTLGFITKLELLLDLMAQQKYIFIAILLIGSVLSIIYLWGFIEAMYKSYNNKQVGQLKENYKINLNQKLAMIVIMCLIIIPGMFPDSCLIEFLS